jgi:hypothetical protein
MNKNLSQFGLLIALASAAVTASASSFGTNITVSDKNYSGSGWYSDREDQETETNTNTVTSQQWDLEGMFMDGSTLTLVGGYDFKNGVNWTDGHNYKSGDIFVDINGDAKYGQADNGASGATHYGSGPHTATMANTFGWDYVLDLNFTTMTYSVFSLTAQSMVSRVMDVASSNPWTYVSGGNAVAGYQNLSLSYISGLTNADTGFGGDSTNSTGWSTGSNQHYALGVDLAFAAGQDVTLHYTMECGNDNLMGKTHVESVPDSATTALLFGLTLLGFVGLRRQFNR